ncbi:rRNA biogenesis protein [Trypanosoma rangeli]|uniref:rRNA biogenesis protein n=1 Tax=Trypanosoma rangeli TaxID=5698 RepID=A0A3R7KD39_TRYRA|nr:rRNA biogenesis protein [Trypanosoma rangeli]RNF05679.1 rRNA biogenesis protein [Trypanosoma rangeli]|eukprot:RNF05679.1 rRNA biogenesis protein [Trypanosoma rangeli]
MLFSYYHVHHAAPDGIVVQLPGNGGFGRLTVETLGGDLLAEKLLKRLASREQVQAVARRTRDSQQYRLLSIQLRELWSDVATYPPPVATLLPNLFRKNVLIGLGTTTMARVVKASPERGAVLSIAGGLTALAALEHVPGDAGTVEVRLLNYDVQTGVANVTARSEVVERTPSDVVAMQTLLSGLQVGGVVSATVLLSCTDDHCAVVEVACGESSLVGYYVYNWPGTAAPGEPPVVGTSMQLVIEFVPHESLLQEVLPFLVLSSCRTVFTLPQWRSAPLPAGERGLLGFFPWRDCKRQHGAGEKQHQQRHPETESDEDDDDGDGGAAKNAGGEHKLRKRKLEEVIDAYERSMETAVPSSPEEFQRLLLAAPNNSYLWVQWMAHHLALQQQEEARLVAEKALSTIGVRETQERMNVWVAYMNLENLHGTAESLSAVFKRAIQHASDQIVVYERLADIFAATRKPNQLLALCRTMVSKFRNEPHTWERLGVVLIDQKKRDQLKRMVKDMGGALRRDAYALTVVRLAIHEYKSGGVENGRALFEGLVVRMPKKSDVWSAYLDQEMALLVRRDASAAVSIVRTLLERAVSTNFSAKVMQQFLTRFMSFERAYGTPADVEKVKARARSYVEAKIHASVGEGNGGGGGGISTTHTSTTHNRNNTNNGNNANQETAAENDETEEL